MDVKNVGGVSGKEVVQLYIGKRNPTVVRPVKELCGFEKVSLCAGETKRVEFKLTEKELSYFSAVYHKWIAEDGVYDVYAGASSRDIRLKGSFVYKGNMPYTVQQTGDAMIG